LVIAATMSRDILEISDIDRGRLTTAMLTDVPDLMAAGQAELSRQKLRHPILVRRDLKL